MGLADKGRLGPHIKHWEKIEPALQDFDLDRIADATGIARSEIERIAIEVCERAVSGLLRAHRPLDADLWRPL